MRGEADAGLPRRLRLPDIAVPRATPTLTAPAPEFLDYAASPATAALPGPCPWPGIGGGYATNPGPATCACPGRQQVGPAVAYMCVAAAVGKGYRQIMTSGCGACGSPVERVDRLWIEWTIDKII